MFFVYLLVIYMYTLVHIFKILVGRSSATLLLPFQSLFLLLSFFSDLTLFRTYCKAINRLVQIKRMPFVSIFSIKILIKPLGYRVGITGHIIDSLL